MSTKRNKIINDAVFGSIELFPICVKIIDTPEFQRLRRIHQLGVASYVYPTANHTRFQHSLGVYHVAKQMMEKLREKQIKLKADFPNLVQEDAVINDQDVMCVCIAALCHDLGHGPFSHVWEVFMNQVSPGKWKHEDSSIAMFKRIWDRLKAEGEAKFPEEDETFICELIRGVENPDAEWKCKGRGQAKSFLYEIVANKRNGVDVDKFAYITQDSYYLGFKTSFDYARLIEMAQVVSDNGRNKLCFKISEELNVFHTFLSRWNLHRRAYRHRVVLLIEKMIVDAFHLANDNVISIDGQTVKLSDTVYSLDTFINMGDDWLFQRLLELPPKHPSHKLVQRIQNRDLYTQVAEKLIPTNKLAVIDESIKDKDDLKKIIDEGLTEDQRALFSVDDFDVEIESFNFGMKARDPMEFVNFYNYDADSAPKIEPRKDSVSSLLTQNIEEKLVLMVWKQPKHDETGE